MRSNKVVIWAIVLAGCLGTGLVSQASVQDVEGVFGVGCGNGAIEIAFWAPNPDGSVIEGVRWFNNDGSVAFPAVKAVAGSLDTPEVLPQAVVLATLVSGEHLEWSDLLFDPPIATEADGVFIIFEFPQDSNYEFSGEGGGPGFGLVSGEGENMCWISGDGLEWAEIPVSSQFAVQAINSFNKSGGVLWLTPPGENGTVQAPEIIDNPADGPSSVFAFPNPFNPSITVQFVQEQAGATDVEIFDLRGRLVKKLFSGHLEPGPQAFSWEGKDSSGRDLPSGVFFVRVKRGNSAESFRITLAK